MDNALPIFLNELWWTLNNFNLKHHDSHGYISWLWIQLGYKIIYTVTKMPSLMQNIATVCFYSNFSVVAIWIHTHIQHSSSISHVETPLLKFLWINIGKDWWLIWLLKHFKWKKKELWTFPCKENTTDIFWTWVYYSCILPSLICISQVVLTSTNDSSLSSI